MADIPNNVQELLEVVKKYGLESLGVYYGNYRGTIVDNADPQKLGRVKIRVPQIMGDNKGDYWAWPKGQPVGEDFGDFFIPPKGSPVWIEFENGDPSRPIWSGGHWAKKNGQVPSEGKLAEPKNRVRKSEKWIFEMNDETDEFKATSKDGGHFFKMDGAGNFEFSGSGSKLETIGNGANQQITGDKNIVCSGNMGVTCVGFGLTATTSNCDLGGVTVTCGGGVLQFTVGGSMLRIDGSGVTIMGKDFLTHTHNGVDPGGGVSGGVS